MKRRPPRSTQSRSSAASDVYKRQDVDLTEKGVAEAEKAGETLKEYGFNFDKAYTSYLKRAVKTLNCVLDKMNLDWIPVEKSWRLNEKHYGELQGLNKACLLYTSPSPRD